MTVELQKSEMPTRHVLRESYYSQNSDLFPEIEGTFPMRPEKKRIV